MAKLSLDFRVFSKNSDEDIRLNCQISQSTYPQLFHYLTHECNARDRSKTFRFLAETGMRIEFHNQYDSLYDYLVDADGSGKTTIFRRLAHTGVLFVSGRLGRTALLDDVSSHETIDTPSQHAPVNTPDWDLGNVDFT
ncbi:MAG: hypothetical protein OEZ58_13330 [Gammaproteobacteria bacterium]|nr:hypothetical protein [Gammaproteobacteria bacterium]MDH5729971.1 hypothetical protein [Gammaproteobacteria bacterium]